MPIVRDFRNFRFDSRRIDRCGKFVAQNSYWKLYAIENLLRLIIHSVLSAQINSSWWNVAVDPKVRQKAEEIRLQYVQKPLHTTPGAHDIYYVFLTDLNRILRANSNLFLPVIPDTDKWILKLESVRLPRNVVGHMNFPNQFDRSLIDDIYSEMNTLVLQLERLGVTIEIP